VIGTAGSDDKCALARRHGATHTINYRSENIAQRVRELTDGAGVKVVFDSVGKDTFEHSLDCLRPFGLLVAFGNASGPVPLFDVLTLMRKGSLYLTRPTLTTHQSSRAIVQEMADDLFGMVVSGRVTAEIGQRYALADAAEAHRSLEARSTTGSTILLP
jgi:NADPH2:quinone reductase